MTQEMDSVEMTQESQGVGRRCPINFRWTAIMTSFLLRCLVEQANLGLKTDKGFKSTAINAVARAVSSKFNMVVNDTHVINRLRHVRKIWLIIKKLKGLSGVSWDDSEKKIIMGIEEFRTYIQSHPSEGVYINKPIEDYEEMGIVCGNDQATGSFARTGSQSSRSLGTRMEMDSTPPTLDSDDQPQGLDDWDFTQSQPPVVESPTASTSKTKEVKKGSKRIRLHEIEVMERMSNGLDRLATAAETDKGVQLSKRLYDEVMTLIGYYNKSDLGLAYDHLNAQHNLATAFINKDHDLRSFWMDGFLRQLGRDGGV